MWHFLDLGLTQMIYLRLMCQFQVLHKQLFAYSHYSIYSLTGISAMLQRQLQELKQYQCNVSHMIIIVKQVNYDLKNLNNWLNANKICLNVGKTEVVPFKSLTKKTDSDLHIKLDGKRLYPTDSVKYIGIIIAKNLNWHHKINNVAAKLNRANAMLSKMWHFVNFNTLKSIYQAIHESHLNYLLTACVQDTNLIRKRLLLQNKSLQTMHLFEKKCTYI